MEGVELIQNGMPNLDPFLLQFLAQNSLTLLTSLGILKGMAKLTPWAVDDQIVQIFTGAIKKGRNHEESQK